MNSAFIRAIRGPILLMVLGALILIDHRGDVSFWRTWPLLLITGGLLVLAERAAIRENPWTAAAPPPRRRHRRLRTGPLGSRIPRRRRCATRGMKRREGRRHETRIVDRTAGADRDRHAVPAE
jgi:hypothetical protein